MNDQPTNTVLSSEDSLALRQAFANMPYAHAAFTILGYRDDLPVARLVKALEQLAADLHALGVHVNDQEQALRQLQNDRDAVRRFFGTA